MQFCPTELSTAFVQPSEAWQLHIRWSSMQALVCPGCPHPFVGLRMPRTLQMVSSGQCRDWQAAAGQCCCQARAPGVHGYVEPVGQKEYSLDDCIDGLPVKQEGKDR